VSGDVQESSLSVMLIVSDAESAVAWYQRALGANLLWDLGGVAGLDLDGAPFFVHEAVPGRTTEPSPAEVGMTTTRIEVFVNDPGALIARAAAAGASHVEQLTDHPVPWGVHQQGGFTDPSGHRWSVGDRSPLARFPRSEQPNLIIQVPRGSAIERQLHDEPPASLRADDVLVQTGPTDPHGVLEALAGEVVLALPAPEGLRRHAAELRRVLDQAGSGTPPLVVVIEAGEELLENEAAPLVGAARTARRPVILRIIRPSER